MIYYHKRSRVDKLDDGHYEEKEYDVILIENNDQPRDNKHNKQAIVNSLLPADVRMIHNSR